MASPRSVEQGRCQGEPRELTGAQLAVTGPSDTLALPLGSTAWDCDSGGIQRLVSGHGYDTRMALVIAGIVAPAPIGSHDPALSGAGSPLAW